MFWRHFVSVGRVRNIALSPIKSTIVLFRVFSAGCSCDDCDSLGMRTVLSDTPYGMHWLFRHVVRLIDWFMILLHSVVSNLVYPIVHFFQLNVLRNVFP